VRTGERGTDSAIAAWLERHGVEVAACSDAFEACTIALKKTGEAPDVAFVGSDWLPADEHVILDYFDEIWPDLITVVYGRVPAAIASREGPRTLVCSSAQALRRILDDAPDALLQGLRAITETQPGIEGDRPVPPGPTPGQGQGGHAPMTAIARGETRVEGQEGRPASPARESALQRGGPRPSGPAPRNVLTDEELAALLEDDL